MHIWGSSVTALKLTTFLLSRISEKPQSQLSEWLVVWTLNLFPYLAFQICIFNIHLLPDHYCGILLSILAPPQSMAIKSYSLINKCNIKLCSLPCPVYCSVFTRAIHLSLSTPGLCCHSLGAVLFSRINVPGCLYPTVLIIRYTPWLLLCLSPWCTYKRKGVLVTVSKSFSLMWWRRQSRTAQLRKVAVCGRDCSHHRKQECSDYCQNQRLGILFKNLPQ